MAGIDKTYTDNYKEYKEFKEWAEGKTIKYWTGQAENVSDYIYEWTESDFGNGELPVMNSPTSLDIYLIQNCPVEFVKERLKSVYPEEVYNEFKEMEFPTKKPIEYKKNRKIKIIKKGNIDLKNKGFKSHGNWWLDSKDGWWFDSDYGVWVRDEDYLPNNTSVSKHKNIKSLIRFLRNQYLPEGLTFRLSGRYINEEFELKIK